MRTLRFNLPIRRAMRFLFAALVCTLLFCTQAYPAFAAGSVPTQGESQLKDIEAKSIDVLEAGGPYSLEKTSSIANEGINEVQGGADKDKMKTPENARNAAPSVEQQVKKNLEHLKDKAVSAFD